MVTSHLFSLGGRVALVTGGNGGLGRAIARGLRDAGAEVVVCGRDARKNADAANEFGADAVIACDVRDEDAVADVVAVVVERRGRFDVLVNNAGIFRGGPVVDLSLDDWETVIGAHLTGAFLCAKHAARVMIHRGEGGKIVNIGSMYSLYGTPGFADYGTAKTGVLGLTRSLAVELAPYGIQVNAICPGWFPTDLTGGLPQSSEGEYIRRKTPLGRWGRPEDLVGPAVFLASRASDFVTGVHFAVDGGYAIGDRLIAD